MSEIDTLRKERDDLLLALQEAAEKLDEAADEIDSWGAYASEYFQEKHDLKGSVSDTRKYAAHFEAIAKGARPTATNNFARAAAIVGDWPQWKKDVTLTKYDRPDAAEHPVSGADERELFKKHFISEGWTERD